ncbi:MAG: hypothetical protein MRY32_07550, partial [Rickettsiales bacterium]|nr:hypothetical protein [Rickettsiales bacterium]
MKKACVIGDPIAHSLSPKVHGYWLQHYNIKGNYTAEHVTADQLSGFLKNLKEAGFAGCNVTIPHKENVFALVDECSDAAKEMKAVNTVVVLEDGRLRGDNTDGYGFIANLKSHVANLSDYLDDVLILG